MKILSLAILFLCFQSAAVLAQKDLTELETTQVSFDRYCGQPLFRRFLVFQDEASLRQAIAANLHSCENYVPPKIDFDKYTLIGTNVESGSCAGEIYFRVRVFRDEARKIYRHVVLFGENPCRGSYSDTLAILVPKLPADYKVVFDEFIGQANLSRNLAKKFGAAKNQTETPGIFTVRPNLEIAIEERWETTGRKIRIAPVNSAKTIPNDAAIEILENIIPRKSNHRFVETATKECYQMALKEFKSGSIVIKNRCAKSKINIVEIIIKFDLTEYDY